MKFRYIFYSIGYTAVFSMALIFTLTFFGALTSPTGSVLVSINTFNEAILEGVFVCIAIPFMIWSFFITYQQVLPLIKKGVLPRIKRGEL
jgi:hypothetical protein